MTKDPKQKSDYMPEGGYMSHDDALKSISKKVDEKLSQITSGSYDDEMERQLAEIQELRRLEKEALEQSRNSKRQKRHRGRSSAKEVQAPVSTDVELFPVEEKQNRHPAVTIAEMAVQAVAEAEAAKKRAAEREATRAEKECAELWENSGKASKDESPIPSRKLDQSIDGFLGGIKSFFGKTAHITKDLHNTRRNMQGKRHLTHEKRMARYHGVWIKHLAPLIDRLIIFGDWLQLRGAQLSLWTAERRANLAVRMNLLGARLLARLKKIHGGALCVLEYAEHRKMKIFGWFAGAVVCAGIAAIIIGNLTAYEYMYNGRVLGLVKDQQVVYKTIDVIGGKLSESLGADIKIDKETDITFRKIVGLGLSIDNKDDVLNSLTYMKTLKAKGYSIVADNKQIAVLQSREIAQSILDDFMQRFSAQREGVEYKSIGFAQDVKIEEIDTELGNIQNTEDVKQYMLTGAVEKKVHVVAKGQTFNAIAKSYGMKPSELETSNPGVDPAKLKIDQQLVLTQDAPVLTVQTKEVATYTAAIAYDIVYEDTSKKYKGEKSVKLPGTDGQRRVVAEIVRNNGVEVERVELSSSVISEPTNQIVLVGTKEKPKTVATGSYAYPVRGARLSSRYGSRWGGTHKGIDLAIARGTTIGAADGGTVTFSGYKGSFGYLVIIDHGNGQETYYAHCSKLLVSRGDKVYKGQAIAKVGSTGRSTGPHLHFEVVVNGVSRNPLNYL